MVRGLAFVPGAPLLVPGLGGAADVLAPLRETCRAAVDALGPGPLVVVGPGAEDGAWTSWTTEAGWGPGQTWFSERYVGRVADPSLALTGALSVGVSLTPRAAVVVSVSQDSPAYDPPDGAGLVVVGDGSACRGPRAPLRDDPRGEPFDRLVTNALANGDPAALLALDPGVAAELGVSGIPAWRAAARMAGRRPWRAQLLAADAPLGVAYTVATWL